MAHTFWAVSLGVCACLLALAGCGLPGAPESPTANQATGAPQRSAADIRATVIAEVRATRTMERRVADVRASVIAERAATQTAETLRRATPTPTPTTAPTPTSTPVPTRATMDDEVTVARSTLEYLTQGNQAAADLIAWEKLHIAGNNIGEQYRALSKDQQATFRKNFITGFAYAFQSSGADLEMLRNWRVKSSSGEKSVVVANDLEGRRVQITLTLVGRHLLLEGIEPDTAAPDRSA
jgi:predicted small lipoprotein YifL